MTAVGQVGKRGFVTKLWGVVSIHEERYAAAADTAIAIQLTWICRELGGEYVEPLARLSVYVERKSHTLPKRCFYVKDWSENAEVVQEAAASGWFKRRADLGHAICGREIVEVWELLEEKGDGFAYDE